MSSIFPWAVDSLCSHQQWQVVLSEISAGSGTAESPVGGFMSCLCTLTPKSCRVHPPHWLGLCHAPIPQLLDEGARINVALGLKLKQYQGRNKDLKQRVFALSEENSKLEQKVPSSLLVVDWCRNPARFRLFLCLCVCFFPCFVSVYGFVVCVCVCVCVFESKCVKV